MTLLVKSLVMVWDNGERVTIVCCEKYLSFIWVENDYRWKRCSRERRRTL